MEDTMFWLAVMSPVVFGVSAAMLPVYLSHRRKDALLKHAHTERMAALEKGLPLPEMPATLLDEIDAPSAVRSMRSGIAQSLVGFVLFFAIRQFLDEDMALFGLIPVAVGIANLVYATVLWRRERTQQPG